MSYADHVSVVIIKGALRGPACGGLLWFSAAAERRGSGTEAAVRLLLA
jgi:hypothetical protein